ncbi:MAG: glutamine--fructose-6-phosphate transaminase (isomerizing) [Flavobacteriales bacterium]|nr:glutamine--fructose-6-phosphate transaminase (isomerizing) [Flavobacteriales bacterium]
MCGIVGYLGEQEAFPLLIKGLKRLEYRGYDSAGFAVLSREGGLKHHRRKGKVDDLLGHMEGAVPTGNMGIGHTRWATHGPPNDVNAHPHLSGNGRLALIHNGIIENYNALKETLTDRGHTFYSDTDTEVLVHLIEEILLKSEGLDLFEATRIALNEVVGAYAIAVVDTTCPDEMVLARKSSPLVIGIGDGEYHIASDATPIIEYTKNVVYLEDEEVARISLSGGLKIRTTKNHKVTPVVTELEMAMESIEKGGYEHFMLKEIHEQPRSIADCLRGRLRLGHGSIRMAGIDDHKEMWTEAKRLIIVACGTSWHAGLIAEYMFEDFARIPVEVEYASEFRYRNPVIGKGDILIAISQSGETADTLAAIRMAKEKGAHVFGICNVVGSSISRESHSGAYTHAGPEIGVASTKAFTAQLAVLALVAIRAGRLREILDEQRFNRLLVELNGIPEKVEALMKKEPELEAIAEAFKNAPNALFLGRGFNFPVALEGALKLKEISYIHAEGYPAAEMKHGPIALIDENMPVFFVATKDAHYDKVVSNIQEVKARGGRVIAIVTAGDKEVKGMAEFVIEVHKTDDALVPLLTTIPFQLLSYHIAVKLDRNVDQPRNLAKSVTVE